VKDSEGLLAAWQEGRPVDMHLQDGQLCEIGEQWGCRFLANKSASCEWVVVENTGGQKGCLLVAWLAQ
jgi:hypothetical protein